eukprot:7568277-Lingulodinium_polyedra.AAC.1
MHGHWFPGWLLDCPSAQQEQGLPDRAVRLKQRAHRAPAASGTSLPGHLRVTRTPKLDWPAGC